VRLLNISRRQHEMGDVAPGPHQSRCSS
jgi:hypothetical protein